jgi:hypothetical protein
LDNLPESTSPELRAALQAEFSNQVEELEASLAEALVDITLSEELSKLGWEKSNEKPEEPEELLNKLNEEFLSEPQAVRDAMLKLAEVESTFAASPDPVLGKLREAQAKLRLLSALSRRAAISK